MQFFVAEATRLVITNPQPLLSLLFISLKIPFAPVHVPIPFKSEDMGCNPV